MMLSMVLWFGLSTAMAAAPAPDPGGSAPTDAPIPAQTPDGVDSPSPTTKADPCESAPPRRDAPFEQELERAKVLYRRGCHSRALDLLTHLDLRRQLAPVPPAVEQQQRLYLGEVLLVLGRRQQARDTFELLLVAHPDVRMGLLEHDPAAIALLELVRAEVVQRDPPPPPPLAPLPRRPMWTYTPYGLGHLKNKDKASFVLYGGMQAAFIATTAYTSATFPRDWKTTRRPRTENPEDFRRMWTLKGINYAAGAGFLATYLLSQRRVTREWRRQQRKQLQVRPTGTGVQGQF
ncbi:MAG: hypothetical protein AB8H79_25255 [Myxococcota bacterium]